MTKPHKTINFTFFFVFHSFCFFILQFRTSERGNLSAELDQLLIDRKVAIENQFVGRCRALGSRFLRALTSQVTLNDCNGDFEEKRLLHITQVCNKV